LRVHLIAWVNTQNTKEIRESHKDKNTILTQAQNRLAEEEWLLKVELERAVSIGETGALIGRNQQFTKVG
jgi:hypothetical protein